MPADMELQVVGYLLMQLPSNMLITRLRPSLYLTTAMMLWGGVSACNAATQKFSDLIVVRFLLGFVEAPFFPGAVFLMSSWYTRADSLPQPGEGSGTRLIIL